MEWVCDMMFCFLVIVKPTWASSRMHCFEWVKWLWEFISAFSSSQNSTWVMSRKRFIKGSTALRNDFFLLAVPKYCLGELQKALIPRTYILPSHRPKMRIGQLRECDVSSCRVSLRFRFFFLGSQNASWMCSRQRYFNGSPGPMNTFSA
jgi:hypothetical protein